MHIGRHSCGAVWNQRGSATGHCCGLTCHRTFKTEDVFDAHRSNGVCVDPKTLLNEDGSPRFETFIDLAGCEVWRSTVRMSDAEIARLAGLKTKRGAA